MADQGGGGIAWTEATWNPVRGCSRISAGCTRCYAERVAARFSGPGAPYEGLASNTAGGPRWTGKVRLIEEHLFDPLRWKRPRKIFVNSMSDLFHEGLDGEEIARVFAVMYLAPRHTFQVLTKRSTRMREMLKHGHPGESSFYREVLAAARAPRDFDPTLTGIGISDPTFFPHKNVWLGVSVEDQSSAEKRIPELLATPAAVRWLSIEPQIGPVDLSKWLLPDPPQWESQIDWVVIGGESGPGARPFDIQWARDLVRQCSRAGVKCFVKQLGAKPFETANVLEMAPAAAAGDIEAMMERARIHPAPAGWTRVTEAATGESHLYRYPRFTSRKGGDPAEWPLDLRVREYPEAHP